MLTNVQKVFFDYNRDTAHLVASIRHGETNYDSFVEFYYAWDSIYPYRADLNRLCDKKRRGEISDAEFADAVSELESRVNLYKKSNQTIFVKRRQEQIAIAHPEYSGSVCKQKAYSDLDHLLSVQSDRRRKNIGTHVPRYYFYDCEEGCDGIDTDILQNYQIAL